MGIRYWYCNWSQKDEPGKNEIATPVAQLQGHGVARFLWHGHKNLSSPRRTADFVAMTTGFFWNTLW